MKMGNRSLSNDANFIYFKSSNSRTPKIKQQMTDFNIKDKELQTLFHFLVSNQIIEASQIMKQTEINVNATNSFGFTHLDLCTEEDDELREIILKLGGKHSWKYYFWPLHGEKMFPALSILFPIASMLLILMTCEVKSKKWGRVFPSWFVYFPLIFLLIHLFFEGVQRNDGMIMLPWWLLAIVFFILLVSIIFLELKLKWLRWKNHHSE